jgi:hypothetical protein
MNRAPAVGSGGMPSQTDMRETFEFGAATRLGISLEELRAEKQAARVRAARGKEGAKIVREARGILASRLGDLHSRKECASDRRWRLTQQVVAMYKDYTLSTGVKLSLTSEDLADVKPQKRTFPRFDRQTRKQCKPTRAHAREYEFWDAMSPARVLEREAEKQRGPITNDSNRYRR